MDMPGEPDGHHLAMRVPAIRPDVKLVVTSGARKACDFPPEIPSLSKPYDARQLIGIARETFGTPV